MSKRARTGRGTRGHASSSQEPTIKDKVHEFGVFNIDTHQGYYDTFSRHPIHPESVIDWAFPYPLCSVACRYDPNFEGILFSLGGEPRKMSLLDFGWRVGLYSEEQSRLSSTMNGLRRGETIKDEHVREDDEVEEAANEEAAGSAETELINSDLICPSRYQLLRNSYGDFGPELSFDKSASLERLFSLARVSLAEASKPVLSFGCSEGDYTSSYVACFLSTYFLSNVSCDNFPTAAPFPSFPINSSLLFTFGFILAIVPLSFLITFSIMAKKDMDLYHSRLTQDDLNDLIIKYKILCDLHPWLLFEEFVMSELLNDAIGINHRMFDFFGVRIPFSSFLLALIKHYRVHFSQLGLVGLNKVITFKVLCRSLQLESTRAILNAMVWRHPDVAIDDPRPDAGSFNMANVRHLSAHVVKLRDMPEVLGIHDFLCLPEWTGAEVQEEPHLDVRPTLQRLPFYYTPPVATDAVIPKPALEDLAIGTPSSKIVAKVEASQKQKASTSGAALSHVAKLTRSALAQSSGSTNRPSLFVGDSDDESDGDDDACVEIPLVTPLRSATVIHPSGNQGRSSTAPAAEGSNARDSRGKGIMFNDAAAPSGGVSQSRLSIGLAPSFRDVFDGAIHMDFFPFSTCPYYATYLEDCVAGNYEFTREEWDAPY
ncbi:hypothetical protein Tco_1238140 [Tanacetum coccineum]